MKQKYLESLNNDSYDSHDLEMIQYAQENNVPIILKEGLQFLRLLCEIKNPKNILEIGSAIGFSSINMAKHCQANIDTIEINEETFQILVKNIKKANLENRIQTFLDDALTIQLDKLKKSYDIIFIDAAKGQYIKFFEKFSRVLEKDGIIVTDNILFHDLIFEDNIQSRNLKALVRKIKGFNEYLRDNTQYVTRVFNIGDGIAVSRKK